MEVLRQLLLHLCPDCQHTTISQVIDGELLSQQACHGVCDFVHLFDRLYSFLETCSAGLEDGRHRATLRSRIQDITLRRKHWRTADIVSELRRLLENIELLYQVGTAFSRGQDSIS